MKKGIPAVYNWLTNIRITRPLCLEVCLERGPSLNHAALVCLKVCLDKGVIACHFVVKIG